MLGLGFSLKTRASQYCHKLSRVVQQGFVFSLHLYLDKSFGQLALRASFFSHSLEFLAIAKAKNLREALKQKPPDGATNSSRWCNKLPPDGATNSFCRSIYSKHFSVLKQTRSIYILDQYRSNLKNELSISGIISGFLNLGDVGCLFFS